MDTTKSFCVEFIGDRSIKVNEGESILNASLAAGIPHYHACGGNAKCSTCRVLIKEGIHNLTPYTEKEKLLTNGEDVLTSLKERESKGGLGIPETRMALFHCRNKHVQELIFQIAHLEHPLLVKGMDGKDMFIKNLLLMLAPEELAVREQEIVSLISTSLIENNEAIQIFSSANEEMIRERLEAVFLDYLHTNIIKE